MIRQVRVAQRAAPDSRLLAELDVRLRANRGTKPAGMLWQAQRARADGNWRAGGGGLHAYRQTHITFTHLEVEGATVRTLGSPGGSAYRRERERADVIPCTTAVLHLACGKKEQSSCNH